MPVRYDKLRGEWLNMKIYDELKRIINVNFREVYEKFIYLDCKNLIEKMFPGEVEESITGLVAYCYIDREEGLSFRPIYTAALKEDSMQIFALPHMEDTLYILRLREEEGLMSEFHNKNHHMYLYTIKTDKARFFDVSIAGIDTNELQAIAEEINESYSCSEELKVLRSAEYTLLDPFRHPAFPDDVNVIVANDSKLERVWVRLIFGTEDDTVFGSLLNEPYNEMGCHKGDIIELALTTISDEKVLFFTGRTATLKE